MDADLSFPVDLGVLEYSAPEVGVVFGGDTFGAFGDLGATPCAAQRPRRVIACQDGTGANHPPYPKGNRGVGYPSGGCSFA